MNKRKSRKSIQQDPNQLSFKFLHKEESIDVHVPKTRITRLSTNPVSVKGLAIKLAQG